MRLPALFALTLGMAALAHALPSPGPPELDEAAAMRISAQAVGGLVGDYSLLDREGRPMRLSRYRGKPVLVSLIFTKCAQTCPTTTRNLKKAVDTLREAFGPGSFAVLTVGFDSEADTPQAMRSFARRQGIDAPDWEFASGDAASIAGLARATGFSYRLSPEGYEHISQLTILDSEGRVFRQVYGDGFELPVLGEPLKQLLGRTAAHYPLWEGLGRRIRLFCTTFDPSTGRYRTDYSFFIGMLISAAMILPFGYWIVGELRRVWGPAGREA